jgi:hypothetical protein
MPVAGVGRAKTNPCTHARSLEEFKKKIEADGAPSNDKVGRMGKMG